ncbi:hypothetical protein chiPu_0032698, partial [Chiloscyllium punctatum]|nr:hypothetical protein [Chiloscyllium punctatum]
IKRVTRSNDRDFQVTSSIPPRNPVRFSRARSELRPVTVQLSSQRQAGHLREKPLLFCVLSSPKMVSWDDRVGGGLVFMTFGSGTSERVIFPHARRRL